MDNVKETTIDGKRVILHLCDKTDAPVVYNSTYAENGESVIEQCKRIDCKPFHLVSISNLRWDEELSPWACDKIVSPTDHFTGEADDYIRCLTEKIIPWAEKQTGIIPVHRVAAGYSMAGLLALYIPYRTKSFTEIASVSGSLWYPDFVRFAQNNSFLRNPDCIYLSIGDKESSVSNKYLQQTESNLRKLNEMYKNMGISSTFELNEGNHYQNAALRLAKGIKYVLDSAV